MQGALGQGFICWGSDQDPLSQLPGQDWPCQGYTLGLPHALAAPPGGHLEHNTLSLQGSAQGVCELLRCMAVLFIPG